MPAKFNIRINRADMYNLRTTLSDIRIESPKATMRAINRTLTGLKTDIKAEIRKEFTAKAKYIDKAVEIKRATVSRPSGRAQMTGRGLPFIAFENRPRSLGVAVRFRRGGPWHTFTHAFRTTFRSGGEAIVERAYKGPRRAYRPGVKYGRLPREYRLPVRQLYSSSVPDMVLKPEVMRAVLAKAAARLDANIERELNAVLKGYASG